MRIFLFASLWMAVLAQSCHRQAAPMPAVSVSAAALEWHEQQERFASFRHMGMILYGISDASDWFAAMDRDGTLYFVHSAGDTLRIAGAERLEPVDLNAAIYSASNENGRLIFTVFGDSCLGGFPNRIQVTTASMGSSPATFTGCAMYLNTPALHDIWALQEWNRYPELSFSPGSKGLVQHPYMELHLHNNTFMAHTGCHAIRGALSPEGRWLRFWSHSLSANECAWEEGRVLESFLQGSLMEYSLLQGQLMLAYEADTLIFKKVD